MFSVFLGFQVLLDVLQGPEWLARIAYHIGGRMHLTHYGGGSVHGSGCSGHVCKQAGKALHFQSMVKASLPVCNKTKYVHKTIRVRTREVCQATDWVKGSSTHYTLIPKLYPNPRFNFHWEQADTGAQTQPTELLRNDPRVLS